MRLRAGYPIIAALLVCACSPNFEVAPPPQKVMPRGNDPGYDSLLAEMSDGSADSYVVSDMLGRADGAEWRWTNQHPRFRMSPEPDMRWRFYATFTVPGVVLRRVGPVTVRFVLNDHVLATRTYKKDGGYKFEQLVPEGILAAKSPAVLGLDIDPVYIAEADGAKLGILLRAIGFRRAE
jgi:hypothetical protein